MSPKGPCISLVLESKHDDPLSQPVGRTRVFLSFPSYTEKEQVAFGLVQADTKGKGDWQVHKFSQTGEQKTENERAPRTNVALMGG